MVPTRLVGTYGDGESVAMPPFLEVEVPIGRLFLPTPTDSEPTRE